jgi:hypothetical protein
MVISVRKNKSQLPSQIVPISLILSMLLLFGWIIGYFVWENWQFTRAVKRELPATITSVQMTDGTPFNFNFKQIFIDNPCVQLHIFYADSNSVETVVLCRVSVR